MSKNRALSHRPAMRLVGLLLALATFAVSGAATSQSADALGSFDSQLLQLINNHRVSLQLSPFTEYAPFSQAALNWSTTNRNAASSGCGGGGPSTATRHDSYANISSQGVPPGTSSAGENVAWACGPVGFRQQINWNYNNMPSNCRGAIDFTTPLMTFCQWVDSSGHRAALESRSFNFIGLGTAVRVTGNTHEPFSTARFAVAPRLAPTPPPTPTGPTCGGFAVTIDMNTSNASGTSGRDVILGTPGNDEIFAGGGNDVICGGLGVDRIFAGAGNDLVYGNGGSDWIYGAAGSDVIYAGSGADRVYGGPAGDEIHGQGGQDFIWGEDGNDVIQGNWQSDRIWGGNGNDILRGAGGKDKIYGQAGNDRLYGGLNTDYLDGGSGFDIGDGQRGRDNPVVTGVSGCRNVEQRISC